MEALELRGATYRVEILTGPALARLIPLFRDAFGREFSAAALERKYASAHGGLTGFSCAAFGEQGEPAGSVGVLSWGARMGERVETAGQMVDVATSSAHRGRGLFVALAERARQVCEETGAGFLFGFPNEEAYPIWIHKLGYEHTDDLVEHRWPVRTLPVARAAHRLGPLGGLYDRYSSRTLAGRSAGDTLRNSLVAEGFAGVDRDAGFHAYKRAFGGSRIVETAGGRAWIKVHHSLMIGDLEATSDAELERTMHDLRRLAARLGVRQIVSQTSKDTRLSRFFAGRPGASRELPVIHRDLASALPRERLRYTLGDLDSF